MGALFLISEPINMSISHVSRVSRVVLLMIHMSKVLTSSISFTILSEMISIASCSTQYIIAEQPCLSSNIQLKSLRSFLGRFAKNLAQCFMNSRVSDCRICIEMQRSQQHRGKRKNESLVGDSSNYRVMVDSQE